MNELVGAGETSRPHYMHKHLLIDGRNIIYRAIYAGRSDNMFMMSGLDIFAVFARFIHYYQVQFRPKSIHIFWDDECSRLWRTKILPTYKGQRKDDDGAKKDVFHILKISLDLYKTLGIRQYFRHTQEADDLIYAFCSTIPATHTRPMRSDTSIMIPRST